MSIRDAGVNTEDAPGECTVLPAELAGASPNHRPMVSVVIPCFNHGRFLGAAIESVLAQTHPAGEILVVDDGSSDDTAEVARRYPVRYVRQDNHGLSAARNTGVRETQGDFLAFLDADDRLLPRCLELGFERLRVAPKAGFVSGRYYRIDESGAHLGGGNAPPPPGDPYTAFLRGNTIGMHAAVLYRRKAIEAVGGFNTLLSACEDYDLYLRISRQFPVLTHEHVVAEYRTHGSNMSRNLGAMLASALQVLELQRSHVAADPERLAALLDGQRLWRRHYANKFLTQTSRVFHDPAARRSFLSNGWSLFRQAPGALAVQLVVRLRNECRPLIKRMLPGRVYRALRRRFLVRPPVGTINFGDLRRLAPVSRRYGYDRGQPIDRYYIERFLDRHAADIRGHTLEIGGNDYTLRYGGDRVSRSDVLHVEPGNPVATIIGDLAKGDAIPSAAFDCVILTQTLHLIYDLRAALATLARILKPGGVLLMTVPGTISQVEDGSWASVWHWGFTGLAMKKLCGEHFAPDDVQLQVHGNVLAAVAFLQGLAAEELRREELDHDDALYPLLITVRAQKRGEPGG